MWEAMVIPSQIALTPRRSKKPYKQKLYMSRHFGHDYIELVATKTILSCGQKKAPLWAQLWHPGSGAGTLAPWIGSWHPGTLDREVAPWHP